MHGREDDDPAVPGGAERGPGVAREEERAREQERDQGVPAVLVELLHRRDVLEAGVRDEGIEPAEALERGLDRRAVPLARGQVGGERVARPVGVGGDVDGEHVPPVGDETLRYGAPDPAGRTGDERDLGQGPPRT